MTKSEFHDLVASAFAEYFPKLNSDDFVAALIDDLQGTDIELEDDSNEDDYYAPGHDDEGY